MYIIQIGDSADLIGYMTMSHHCVDQKLIDNSVGLISYMAKSCHCVGQKPMKSNDGVNTCDWKNTNGDDHTLTDHGTGSNHALLPPLLLCLLLCCSLDWLWDQSECKGGTGQMLCIPEKEWWWGEIASDENVEEEEKQRWLPPWRKDSLLWWRNCLRKLCVDGKYFQQQDGRLH